MDFMDGLALRSRQPSGPCRSQNRSSRRRASLSRHYCDPAPCLASSRDRPWNRHCKELDRCSFIRDATIGRTSTVRPRVGRQRHWWPAVKTSGGAGARGSASGRGGQILRPPKATRWAWRSRTRCSRCRVPRRPTSDPNPAYPTAGADGDAWRRPASPPGCTGSAATPDGSGASRAVALDMIDGLITSGTPGRPVTNQAAGITLWLSRNILVGS